MNRIKKGEVILFPTDTVIGIGCLMDEECARRLRKITKRPKEKPFSILLADKEDIEKWVKEIPPHFHTLSKLLPGPLTLIFKGKDILIDGVLSEKRTVGIRIPDYEPIQDLIRNSKLPLIATSANISGKPPPLVIEDVELKVDGVVPGAPGSGHSSTILDISEKRLRLLRRGQISIIEIENLTNEEVLLAKGVSIHILYVCSANMCRSPMADIHIKSLIGDLEYVEVRSAGVRAISGAPTSIGARRILEENNIEAHHLSAPVAKPILDWADLIFVMEEWHRNHLIESFPKTSGKTLLLRNFKDDSESKEIEDPIGKGIDVYRETFFHIETANKRIEAYLRRKSG